MEQVLDFWIPVISHKSASVTEEKYGGSSSRSLIVTDKFNLFLILVSKLDWAITVTSPPWPSGESASKGVFDESSPVAELIESLW